MYRAAVSKLILSSESDNAELKQAAQKAVDCPNSTACSLIDSFKRPLSGKPDAPKEQKPETKTKPKKNAAAKTALARESVSADDDRLPQYI